MENNEVTELFNKFKDLVTENENLRGTKENVNLLNHRISTIVTTLQQAINDLNDLNNLINPQIKINIQNKKYGSNRIIALELFEKMNSGTQITRKLIETTYNINDVKAHNIMSYLTKLKGVVNVKDGKTTRLFIK